MERDKGTLFIDFDGTIVTHKFPEIGDPMPGAFSTLKALKKAGYRLVLWTCRENENEWGEKANHNYLDQALEFCKENGVEFDGANESLDADEWRPKEHRRKPHCRCVIDDRNFGGFPGWAIVKKKLIEDRK